MGVPFESLEPIIITVVEPDVNQVMLNFDAIQVFRSITGPNGAYSEVTKQGTRPWLVKDQTTYTFTDSDGAADYYYKYRYFNTVTQAFDTFSTPERGEPEPALQVISIEELKDIYLFGVDLTDDAGRPYSNAMFTWYIKAAVDWMEKRLDIPILPRRYDDERHDYYKYDYNKYIWLKLSHYPVIGISEVKLVLPGEQIVKVF